MVWLVWMEEIELEARSPKPEARSPKLEARGSKLEARGSKLDYAFTLFALVSNG